MKWQAVIVSCFVLVQPMLFAGSITPIVDLDAASLTAADCPPGFSVTGGQCDFRGGIHPRFQTGSRLCFSSKSFSTLDQQVLRLEVRIDKADSKFALTKCGAPIAGTFAEVDCSARHLAIYNAWQKNIDPKTVNVSAPIEFNLVPGRCYAVTLAQDVGMDRGYSRRFQTLTLTDETTLESSSVQCWCGSDNHDAGEMWGAPGICFESGSVTVLRFLYGIPIKHPSLVIIGDSIVEGNSIPDFRNQCWARIVGTTRGHTIISGMGGSKSADLVARANADIASFPHATVIISVGTNDYDFKVWLENIRILLGEIGRIGGKAILCTVPPHPGGGNQHAIDEMNTWIRSSGLPLVDFQKALTGHTGKAEWISAYGPFDGTHPNVTGHGRMASEVMLEHPELFTDAGN